MNPIIGYDIARELDRDARVQRDDLRRIAAARAERRAARRAARRATAVPTCPTAVRSA